MSSVIGRQPEVAGSSRLDSSQAYFPAVEDRHRGRARRLALAAACSIAALSACAAPAPAPAPQQQPSTPTSSELFSAPDSFWRTPVPADAPADPRSAQYIKRMEGLEPVIAIRNFTTPIYRADANSPRYRVTPTADYATPDAALNAVPIPDHAQPDPAGDGHLAVYDSTSNCLFEMYRGQRTADGWTAEWINATPGDGDGIYPDGLSTRGSGISVAAGLVWPEELRDGKIDHALVFAYPFTRASGPVPPATRSDGDSRDAAALPVGARLVLDPTLDLSTLELTPAESMIAEALQRYGMILADAGGGLSLFAVNPQSYPADPYAAIFGPVTYAGIGGIPVNRLKVLPLGEERDPYQGPVTPNRCTDAANGR